MKRFLTVIALAVSLVMAASFKNSASAQANVGVNITYQDFYDELSPYGQWMDYPEYGYVWIPRMGSDFQPYRTNGHWVWSDDYEWIWASDYKWGWAPFHYGRWFQDPMYGWMWMPGYEWSPAWVAWRDGGDYYGWAPLRPGFSISIGFGSYNPPVDYWSFAPRRYISSPRIYDYCMPRQQNVTIINHTTIINNYNRRSTNIFVSNGPRRGDVERYAGRINPVRLREINSPGRTRFRGNELSVYRPNIRRDNDRNFAPGNFERYNRDGGNNNIVRRNGNNLPEHREGNSGIDRRDNTRQGSNDNSISDRRRNFPDRNNEAQSQPGNGQSGNAERMRDRSADTRPVDRNNTIDQPGRSRTQRPNGWERRSTNVPAPSENRRVDQPRERGNTNVQTPSENRQFNQPRERRNTNVQSPSENRGSDRQPQRRMESQQRSPQTSREPSRQFENRGQSRGSEQRGGGGDRGRRNK